MLVRLCLLYLFAVRKPAIENVETMTETSNMWMTQSTQQSPISSIHVVNTAPMSNIYTMALQPMVIFAEFFLLFMAFYFYRIKVKVFMMIIMK